MPCARFLIALIAVSVAGCLRPLFGGAEPAPQLGRLSGARDLVFAQETTPRCALEALQGGANPSASATWFPVPMNALSNRPFVITEGRFEMDARGMGSRILRIADGATTMWIRNVASASIDEIESRWACAVTGGELAFLAHQADLASAHEVHLTPDLARCPEISPITGATEDVYLGAYVPIARRVYLSTQGHATLGVTLSSPSGDRAITVSSAQLRACFSAAPSLAFSSDDADRFERWIRGSPDRQSPPALPLQVAEALGGIDPDTCVHDASIGGLTECRQPVMLAHATSEQDPYGVPTVRFEGVRAVDSIRARGGRLVSGIDAADTTLVVRPAVKGPLAHAIAEAIAASVDSPERQNARGARGLRLERTPLGVGPTYVASIADVTYSVAPARIGTIAANASAQDEQEPDHEEARVRARIDAAAKDESLLARLSGDAPACDARHALCDYVAGALAELPVLHRRTLDRSLLAARDRAQRTTQTLATSPAEHHKARMGRVRATIRVAPIAGGAPAFAGPITFEVSTSEALERAIADRLVSEVERLALGWLRERGASSVVTRTAAIARHAAGGRPVKWMGDAVARDDDTVSMRLPADAADRCFTFVAAGVDARGGIGLVVGQPRAGGVVRLGEDMRHDRTDGAAAIELCHLPPGDVLVTGSWGDDRRDMGMVLALYDSTPGQVIEDRFASSAK